MCLAIPGKIIEINGHSATVQYPQETRKVMLGDDLVKIGDYVMVQMGIVLKVLTDDEVSQVKEGWKLA